MGEDVKIQLGIDIEALKRSATEATNILSKAFEQQQAQQGIGASLLGSGVAATQMPQSKDTIRGVIDVLDRIEKTLITGFTSLAGSGVATALSTWQMSQNGGGSGGGGGGGGPLALPPPKVPKVPKGWGESMSEVDAAVAPYNETAKAVAEPLRNAINSGGYRGDMYKLGGAALNSPAGNLLGPLKYGARIFFDYMNSEQLKKENFRDQQYEMWKSGGNGLMKDFTESWTTDQFGGSATEGMEKRYGIGLQESFNLRRQAARTGADANAVLQMQGTLGAGAETSALSGALKRSGNKGDIDDMAKIIGAAISSGLDQSKFPDAMDAVQRAAESSTATNLDLQREVSIMSFIGAGGQSYAPGTAKYNAMRGSIESVVSDQASPLAMMSAYKQSGGKWADMQMMMAKGTGVGGVDPKKTIDDLWNQDFVQNWAKSISPDNPEGSESLLNWAAYMLKLSGVNAELPQIAQILKDRAKDTMTGPSIGQVQAGKELITAPPPEVASSHARADADKQQAGVLGDFGKTQDTSGNTQSPQQRAAAIDAANRGATASPSGSMVVPDFMRPSGSMMTRPAGDATGSGVSTNDDFLKAYVPSGGAYQSSRPAGSANGSPTGVHPGIDITNIQAGQLIHSPVDGKVEVSKMGTGNEVGFDIMIRANDGQTHTFEHLIPINPQDLTAGKSVYKGQLLGKKAAGKEFAPGVPTHVHYGVRSANGKPIDPAKAGVSLPSILDPVSGRPGVEVSPSGIPLDDSPRGKAEAARLQQINEVIHRVEVHLSHDNAGRIQARVKGPGPTTTGPSGQQTSGKKA